MARKKKSKAGVYPIYGFAAGWALSALIFPLYKVWGMLAAFLVSCLAAFAVYIFTEKKAKKSTVKRTEKAEKSSAEEKKKDSYGPEIDPIVEEGRRALGEMGRLYSSITEPDVREKINEIMRITDKITQDAIADPSDIPQIRKFMNYYLPTTIKLLNTYDRMRDQGIQGENLDKSMSSINEMLDEAIVAFRKRLDSLFADQAMDIEADIKVMNTMLEREGLSGEKDFEVQEQKGQTS